MITLPCILNQKDIPGCICFSVAGLSNYYLQQKGIKDEIDAVKLYDTTERGGNGANARVVLDYGKNIGLPGISGKTYKIREVGAVQQSLSQIESAIKQHGGIIITYALHDGDPINDRITTDFVLSRAPMDVHALVAVGFDTTRKRIRCANSWGKFWQDGGYFYIPYVLLRTEFLKQCFWFSLQGAP